MVELTSTYTAPALDPILIYSLLKHFHTGISALNRTKGQSIPPTPPQPQKWYAPGCAAAAYLTVLLKQ